MLGNVIKNMYGKMQEIKQNLMFIEVESLEPLFIPEALKILPIYKL